MRENMYNIWGYGVVRGGFDRCSCADGKVGYGSSTYHNNQLLGSAQRPVLFTKLIRMEIGCGEEVDVLVADREFFDRLRFDCTPCREFFGRICTCIEFGDIRPVFLSSGNCERLLPLETSRNGFMIHADQIQPFGDSRQLLRLTACFDPHNDHVTISNYYNRHVKCDCTCEDRRYAHEARSDE